jgi:hypothetical protein
MPTLERIGESRSGPGWLLLKLLSLHGWDIAVVARGDGEAGVTVSARKLGRRPVEISGGSVAELAARVVLEASERDQAARRYAD